MGDTDASHVDAPAALRAHAAKIGQLLSVARTKEERATLDYLVGAVHALLRAIELGFMDRSKPVDESYWERPREWVGLIQEGNAIPDGPWLAGFYFNSALARIAAVFERMVALVEIQLHGEKQWGRFYERLEKLSPRYGTRRRDPHSRKPTDEPSFDLETGGVSNAFLVCDEVNSLKHDPLGLSDGRDAMMQHTIAALTEVLSFADQRVKFSGSRP
jgi:hypothetical protein